MRTIFVALVLLLPGAALAQNKAPAKVRQRIEVIAAFTCILAIGGGKIAHADSISDHQVIQALNRKPPFRIHCSHHSVLAGDVFAFRRFDSHGTDGVEEYDANTSVTPFVETEILISPREWFE